MGSYSGGSSNRSYSIISSASSQGRNYTALHNAGETFTTINQSSARMGLWQLARVLSLTRHGYPTLLAGSSSRVIPYARRSYNPVVVVLSSSSQQPPSRAMERLALLSLFCRTPTFSICSRTSSQIYKSSSPNRPRSGLNFNYLLASSLWSTLWVCSSGSFDAS